MLWPLIGQLATKEIVDRERNLGNIKGKKGGVSEWPSNKWPSIFFHLTRKMPWTKIICGKEQKSEQERNIKWINCKFKWY